MTPITIIVNTVEGRPKFSVGSDWPQGTQITKGLIEQLPPYLDIDGDKLRFSMENGWAIYRTIQYNEFNRVYDCILLNSEFRPSVEAA